jgi:hypothetical protein
MLSRLDVEQRDDYLHGVNATLAQGERRIVYLDESFLLHSPYHSTQADASLQGPAHSRSPSSAQRKGQRYGLIAAIVSDKPGVEGQGLHSLSPHDQAHLLPSTLRIVEWDMPAEQEKKGARAARAQRASTVDDGGNSSAAAAEGPLPAPKRTKKKPTKEALGVFTGDYFVAWMDVLLKALADEGIAHAVIVMDNAVHHKVLPADTPRQGWARAALLEACARYGLAVPPDAKKCEHIWPLLSAYIHANIRPAAVAKAEAAGHTVLFTPPHFSDLQPMETVWAIVKGWAGALFRMEQQEHRDAKVALQNAIAALEPRHVRGCIRVAHARLADLHPPRLVPAHASDEQDPEGWENSEAEAEAEAEEQDNEEVDDDDDMAQQHDIETVPEVDVAATLGL